jgi:hypothetical protein
VNMKKKQRKLILKKFTYRFFISSLYGCSPHRASTNHCWFRAQCSYRCWTSASPLPSLCSEYNYKWPTSAPLPVESGESYYTCPLLLKRCNSYCMCRTRLEEYWSQVEGCSCSKRHLKQCSPLVIPYFILCNHCNVFCLCYHCSELYRLGWGLQGCRLN